MPIQLTQPSLGKARQNALALRGAELQNALVQKQLEALPKEQAYREEVRGRERKLFGTEQTRLSKEAFYTALERAAQTATWETYPQYREYLQRMAEDAGEPFRLPSEERIFDFAMKNGKMPEEVFNEQLEELRYNLMSPSEQTQRIGALSKEESESWGSPQSGIDEEGNRVFFQTNKEGQARIVSGVQPKPEKGMKIYDREGNLLVDMGGEGGKTTVKTKGAVEEKAFNASEAVSRLNEIAVSYRPEFLQLGTKLGALNTKWQSIGKGTPIETGLAIVFGKASEENKNILRDFANFRRDSLSNINLYIKEITGAQMSEKEANRLRQAMPDPGEGIFDGDSPEEFESKWNSVMSSLRLAQARYAYLLNNNVSSEAIANMINVDALPSLEQVRSIMNTRQKELEKEIKRDSPELSQAEINATIKMKLKNEFNI